MIPRKGFTGIFVRFAGEEMLLAMAQHNVLSHVGKIKNGRTHTFLSNNGQTEEGISQNSGAERCYTWQDTIIDCRQTPGLIKNKVLEGLSARIQNVASFQSFQKAIQERSGGFLEIQAFSKVMSGCDNKRYNIRLESKYEAFDIIRVGIKVTAKTPDDYSRGLKHLLDWEKRNHPDYEGMLILPTKASVV